MIEKITEQKWMIACYLLIVSTALRCFDLLTEGGLITVWLLVAGGYFAAEITAAALARKRMIPPDLDLAERQATAHPRDWPLDFAQPTRMHPCINCTRNFIGAFRRSLCRECAGGKDDATA